MLSELLPHGARYSLAWPTRPQQRLVQTLRCVRGRENKDALTERGQGTCRTREFRRMSGGKQPQACTAPATVPHRCRRGRPARARAEQRAAGAATPHPQRRRPRSRQRCRSPLAPARPEQAVPGCGPVPCARFRPWRRRARRPRRKRSRPARVAAPGGNGAPAHARFRPPTRTSDPCH